MKPLKFYIRSTVGTITGVRYYHVFIKPFPDNIHDTPLFTGPWKDCISIIDNTIKLCNRKGN